MQRVNVLIVVNLTYFNNIMYSYIIVKKIDFNNSPLHHVFSFDV